jgi:threonine aldolase
VLSQPTEYGLAYTPEEIEEICLCAHENNALVLVDGSRLFFAAATLLRPFREQTLFAGVDVATFGAAKNGVVGGEAVLTSQAEIAERFRKLQKEMHIDLSGAGSFSYGFDCLLTYRLWRKRALHANEMAAALGNELSGIPGVRLVCSVETNKVIAEVPPGVLQLLSREYSLRTFRCPGDVVRFVTNYTTSGEDISRLIGVLR